MCGEKVDLKNSWYFFVALGYSFPVIHLIHLGKASLFSGCCNNHPLVLTDLRTMRPSQGKMSLCSSPKSLATWILPEQLKRIIPIEISGSDSNCVSTLVDSPRVKPRVLIWSLTLAASMGTFPRISRNSCPRSIKFGGDLRRIRPTGRQDGLRENRPVHWTWRGRPCGSPAEKVFHIDVTGGNSFWYRRWNLEKFETSLSFIMKSTWPAVAKAIASSRLRLTVRKARRWSWHFTGPHYKAWCGANPPDTIPINGE